MEIESAVTENGWTNANGNFGFNSFSSETENLIKKRTDKVQRSSLSSSSSATHTKESEDVSSFTSEGSTENSSNSYGKADKHERQERTRKRRSVNSRASSASSKTTSITSNNDCLKAMSFKEQTLLQAKCCLPPKSIKKNLEEYAKRILTQTICFPQAIMNCNLIPLYSNLSCIRPLYLKDLIGNCFYEYELMCRSGIHTRGLQLYSYIDATCFCKHKWRTKKEMPERNRLKKFIRDPYIAQVICLCQLEVTSLENAQNDELITYSLDLDKVLQRYYDTISQISCTSFKLEDRSFRAQCIIDNTKDYTKKFVTLSDVKKHVEHVSNDYTTSIFSDFNNTFCFMKPEELYNELSTKTVDQTNRKEQSINNPSTISMTGSNSNPVAAAGVTSIVTIGIMFFGIMFFGIISLLVILILYKKKKSLWKNT